MNVLHAFSNWKWTGPAEPAVRLAEALRERHDVTFACGRCPYDDLENLVQKHAIAAGLPVLTDLRLRKHFDPLNGWRDLRRLTAILGERRFDVVHTHLLNDHLIGGAAARRAKTGAIVVRSLYGGRDVSPPLRTRLALSRFTDGVVAASQAAFDAVTRTGAVPAERVFLVPGAVDVRRFAPERLSAWRDEARAELGLAPHHVVGGIVARIQRHRKFEMLIAACAQAMARDDRLRVVILGRGTHAESLVHAPLRELGLEDRVLAVGYKEGKQYLRTLAALDFGFFLVPGSDGSCRAARELLASSLPLLVTRRAPLPEIVGDDEAGFVLDDDPAAFAAAMLALAREPERLARLRHAARTRAESRFSLRHQADEVASCYERLRSLGPRRR